MSFARQEPIDWALLAGAALTAGGLAVVAPWEVIGTAACVLASARLARRAGIGAALIVGAALTTGVIRARAVASRHEDERASADAAMARPSRCSGRARVESSPIRLRGTLRWDARVDGTSPATPGRGRNLDDGTSPATPGRGRNLDDGTSPATPGRGRNLDDGTSPATPGRGRNVGVTCDDDGVSWAGKATLYGGPDDLARGDEVDFVATLAAPQRLWNRATGDPRPAEAQRGAIRTGGALDVRIVHRSSGLLARIDRARGRVRDRIDATFAPDVAPMARALVLGENDLAPDDDRSFRASGLSHLLAVSGMHLVLVLAVAIRTLEAILARVERVAARVDGGRVAAAIGIPVAWVYAELAGAGGSTVRAAWMATAALAARALGRRSDVARAFGLSMAVMAWTDPLVAFDLSFVLSAGATAGLIAFGRPFGERIASCVPRVGQAAARAVGSTIAASLPCVPIIACFAPTVPIGGVLANLVAVPLGECAALPLCLAHPLLGWWPAAERGCAVVASGALEIVRAIARAFSVSALTADIPQPTSWQLAVLAAAFAAIALRLRHRIAVLALAGACMLVLEVGARRAGTPRGLLRATFLDVGQGDSAIVDLPDGQALVVDGGGLVGSPIDVGARVLAPELRARRRRTLAAAVLTHPHPDHFGGLVTGLDAVQVSAFWDTGQGEREQVGGGYAALLAGMRKRGVSVVGPDGLCGTHLLGGARIDVLAPCPSFSSDRGPNDNSFVLRIAYGARVFLLVGDAEQEEEDWLLANDLGLLRADVLKVGHHGSRTSSSPAFLAAVAPSEAIVSVGQRNRFGHPCPATLATLTAAGARVWRTDRDGAVSVTTDGSSLDVTTRAAAR